MADASDSKSDVGDYVWVQVPSPAFFMHKKRLRSIFSSVFFHIKIQISYKYQVHQRLQNSPLVSLHV